MPRRGRALTSWPGDDRPDEGYLAQVRRLTAAPHQAEEIVLHEYVLIAPEDHDDQDGGGEPAGDGERPLAVDRSHPLWTEVNAEQQERMHGPAKGGGVP